MKNMIDDNFIKNHTLLECLQEFKGAQKYDSKSRLDSVTEEFKALAKKLLYGGYFLISDSNNQEILKIELRSVEFYYHEEKDDLVDKNDKDDKIICDPIMYHKNPKTGKKKEPFKTGVLNPHQSGIDITFEDYSEGKKAEDVVYRASALIRSFDVISDEGRKTDECSTHLYDYMLNNSPLAPNTEIKIKWVEAEESIKDELYWGRRLNVFTFDDKGNKTINIDDRKWGFAKLPIEITHKDKNKKSTPETYKKV